MSKKRRKRIFIDTSKAARKRAKGSKADQALRLAKKNDKAVKGLTEFKANNINLGATALNATPAVSYLEPLGNGFDTQIVSVYVKGVIKQNLTSTIIDDYRLDLVLDREPNKVAITPLLYLQSATPAVYNHKVFEDRSRYKIIKSWSGYFKKDDSVARKLDGFYSINLKAKNDTVDDFGQTHILNNALYLVYWTTAASNQPTIEFKTRIVTKDT